MTSQQEIEAALERLEKCTVIGLGDPVLLHTFPVAPLAALIREVGEPIKGTYNSWCGVCGACMDDGRPHASYCDLMVLVRAINGGEKP
jgi:hypothetical protein